MAQIPRELTPFESVLHFFGAELRHWRTTRGLSQAQLGARTHDSASAIGKIEIAQRRPTLPFARRLDAVLDSGGVFERLLLLAENEAPPPAQEPAQTGSPADPELGLAWNPTPAATVATVADLWKADMQRRTMISSLWVAAVLAEPIARWLVDAPDQVTHAGIRRVGQADVDALWTMCEAFADADHQLGGGYARSTLIHYADRVVAPLLDGTYTETVGRGLFAASARLCDIAGFMCFDSGRQGLGQRYFIQALRTAKISDSGALGAHILADMSMQAHYQRHAREALALAEAAVTTARNAGSSSTLARCHAIHARALALSGDAGGSQKALNEAEDALGRATPDDEPFWIRFFTAQQLATESMYAAADLGRSHDVRHHAAEALAPANTMRRRQVLATATLASSHLPAEGDASTAAADVDHACELLSSIVPVVGSLSSARVLTSINDVRRRLTAFPQRPAVQQIEHDLHQALTAA